jgi:hypothetical protein
MGKKIKTFAVTVRRSMNKDQTLYGSLLLDSQTFWNGLSDQTCEVYSGRNTSVCVCVCVLCFPPFCSVFSQILIVLVRTGRESCSFLLQELRETD